MRLPLDGMRDAALTVNRLTSVGVTIDSIKMVTFERRVGRLVEILDDGEAMPAGLPEFGRVLMLAAELGKDELVVICADMRRARSLPPELTGRISLAVRTSLTRVLGGATLLSHDPTAARQFARIFGEGHGDRGLIVRAPAEAVAALEPILTAPERTRLLSFLGC